MSKGSQFSYKGPKCSWGNVCLEFRFEERGGIAYVLGEAVPGTGEANKGLISYRGGALQMVEENRRRRQEHERN